MMNRGKPVCGLLTLGSRRFIKHEVGKETPRGTYLHRIEDAADEMKRKLSAELKIVDAGMITETEDVTKALKLFVNEDVDFVLTTFMSWSEDFTWVRFLRDVPDLPLVFYLPVEEKGFENAVSEDDFAQFLVAGGLVGMLEGSGSLKRLAKRARTIVGSGEEALERIRAFARAAKARGVLKRARFGLLQSFNEVMWSTYVDPYQFFNRVGPELMFISFDILNEHIDAVDDGDVKSYIERLKACYKVDEEIDQLKFFAAAKASIGIAALAKDMDLDALVLNDIDSQLHKKVGLRPGFYHESFNERGSVLVPEGDVGTALACLALKIMTGKHIGFIEPFYIDAPHNRFCAGHAGPFDHTDERFRENVVIAPDARYEKAPYKFAGAPFAWHRIPPGPMTMAHFSECKGDYKVICTIVDSLPGRHIIKGYSHSVFEPRVKVEKLFEDIIEAGAHQHFALVEGDALSELKEWAYINNFDYHYIAEEK
ncbi:MAG: hypothetical protein PHD91_01360 [bacterium]|nr:hypothetical protein [bacterium]